MTDELHEWRKAKAAAEVFDGDSFVPGGGVERALDAYARLVAEDARPPVDLAVEMTRAILHAHQRATSPPDGGWGNMSYLRGSYDHLPIFQAALAEARRYLAPREVSEKEIVEKAHKLFCTRPALTNIQEGICWAIERAGGKVVP